MLIALTCWVCRTAPQCIHIMRMLIRSMFEAWCSIVLMILPVEMRPLAFSAQPQFSVESYRDDDIFYQFKPEDDALARMRLITRCVDQGYVSHDGDNEASEGCMRRDSRDAIA